MGDLSEGDRKFCLDVLSEVGLRSEWGGGASQTHYIDNGFETVPADRLPGSRTWVAKFGDEVIELVDPAADIDETKVDAAAVTLALRDLQRQASRPRQIGDSRVSILNNDPDSILMVKSRRASTIAPLLEILDWLKLLKEYDGTWYVAIDVLEVTEDHIAEHHCFMAWPATIAPPRRLPKPRARTDAPVTPTPNPAPSAEGQVAADVPSDIKSLAGIGEAEVIGWFRELMARAERLEGELVEQAATHQSDKVALVAKYEARISDLTRQLREEANRDRNPGATALIVDLQSQLRGSTRQAERLTTAKQAAQDDLAAAKVEIERLRRALNAQSPDGAGVVTINAATFARLSAVVAAHRRPGRP